MFGPLVALVYCAGMVDGGLRAQGRTALADAAFGIGMAFVVAANCVYVFKEELTKKQNKETP